MLIQLVGLSHKTAPVELRERLHIEESQLPAALQKVREVAPEAMIFSTCNRFEILARVEQLDQAKELLTTMISDLRGVPQKEFKSLLYSYAGPEAIRHVFRVASS